MKIGLVDVDSHNFPNLPLMKLSAWHKQQGDSVSWANGIDTYDCVYKSKIFTSTPDNNTSYQTDKIIEGGTGYCLNNRLPFSVEDICPDYSLYPMFNEAYGFLTRGCPRGCKFCVVSIKEGRQSYHAADLADFCRGQKVIKLLDPNILACNERDRLLQQLIDSNARIDFTQGLDIRFVDAHIAKMLASLRIKMIHFSWDNPDEDLTSLFIKAKEQLPFDERRLRVYVLTNFDSTHEQDLYRVYKLREMGYDPYIMIYDKENAPQETRHLQRWVNNKIVWRVCERFENFNPKLA
jgi:hypothetical protein